MSDNRECRDCRVERPVSDFLRGKGVHKNSKVCNLCQSIRKKATRSRAYKKWYQAEKGQQFRRAYNKSRRALRASDEYKKSHPVDLEAARRALQKWRASPKGKAWRAAYGTSPQRRATMRAWSRSPGGREAIRRYGESDKGKAARLRSNHGRRSLTGCRGALTAQEWSQIKDEYLGRCAYCGIQPPDLTQDHRIPVSRGGAHDWTNIVPACGPCNFSKGNKTPEEWAAWKAHRSVATAA